MVFSVIPLPTRNRGSVTLLANSFRGGYDDLNGCQFSGLFAQLLLSFGRQSQPGALSSHRQNMLRVLTHIITNLGRFTGVYRFFVFGEMIVVRNVQACFPAVSPGRIEQVLKTVWIRACFGEKAASSK
jgi:hypothetical protein